MRYLNAWFLYHFHYVGVAEFKMFFFSGVENANNINMVNRNLCAR